MQDTTTAGQKRARETETDAQTDEQPRKRLRAESLEFLSKVDRETTQVVADGSLNAPLIVRQMPFITDAEVKTLLEFVEAQDESNWQHSEFTENNGPVKIDRKFRDSHHLKESVVVNSPQEINSTLNKVMKRATNLVQMDEKSVVCPWIIRYKPGPDSVGVGQHTDFVPGERRAYTVILYLTTHSFEEGGLTSFLNTDSVIASRAISGSAIGFRVASRDGLIKDKNADHLGLALKGTKNKYILQCFIKPSPEAAVAT